MDAGAPRLNIFYLDNDPKVCAEMHVDKHCVKMILEYAQLLSTAHRVLDGTQHVGVSKTGRRRTVLALPDARDDVLYSATHINHPSAVWVRQSRANYNWLVSLFDELCKEYTYRYGKTHKTSALIDHLTYGPRNISVVKSFTEPTPAMPDQYKVPGNSIQSYKNYYNGEKQRMFSWKKRDTPGWINKINNEESIHAVI
jgi:hypothetical protein